MKYSFPFLTKGIISLTANFFSNRKVTGKNIKMIKMKLKSSLTLIIVVMFIAQSCTRSHTPKPYGYFRIDLPAKQYLTYSSGCSYSFEYPKYGKIVPYEKDNKHPCWINIDFPKYKSRIYISYYKVTDSLSVYLEDARSLAYKHTVKAESIEEKLFINNERHVYGILYDIKGNTASSVNFFLTDSVKNFIRGALYFNVQPNKDSLAPVIDFFKKDIYHIIETLQWKE